MNKQFILRIWAAEWAVEDGPLNYEEWSTLKEAEDRAKTLRKQGAQVILYQEV